MKHPQDLDNVVAHTIGHDVTRLEDHQFARTENPARSAQPRLLSKERHRI